MQETIITPVQLLLCLYKLSYMSHQKKSVKSEAGVGRVMFRFMPELGGRVKMCICAEEHSWVFTRPHGHFSSIGRTRRWHTTVSTSTCSCYVSLSYRVWAWCCSSACSSLRRQISSHVSSPVSFLTAATQQHGNIWVPHGINEWVDGPVSPCHTHGHGIHDRIEGKVSNRCDDSHEAVRTPAEDNEDDHNEHGRSCSHFTVEAEQVCVRGDGSHTDLGETHRFADVVVAKAHKCEWKEVAHDDQGHAVHRPHAGCTRVENVHAVVKSALVNDEVFWCP